MPANVARSVNQETRLEGGIRTGSLTNHEVSKPERGQAHVDRNEAGRDGDAGKADQRDLQGTEDRQGKRIHRQKHGAQVRS